MLGFLTKGLRKKEGLPPGTLIYTGEKKVDKPKITIMDYDSETLEEKEIDVIEACFGYRDTRTVTWININGIHDIQLIERSGKCFNIDPMVLEDILNVDQRPKFEDHDTYNFIVLKMLQYDLIKNEISVEQVGIILTANCLISFQEMEGDVFSSVRQRIRAKKGKIRKLGTDYLAWALIDAIIDGYFTILESVGEKLQNLEEELKEEPTTNTLYEIYKLKRELTYLRRSVWPLREIINSMWRGESELIHDNIEIYLRDLHDHTIQAIDSVDTLRDVATSMIDLYLSSVSNRMNEVMKVLTVIATIFIPLSFLAGLYGMNFANMPELGWELGYPLLLLAMLFIGIIMLLFFKKRKWL